MTDPAVASEVAPLCSSGPSAPALVLVGGDRLDDAAFQTMGAHFAGGQVLVLDLSARGLSRPPAAMGHSVFLLRERTRIGTGLGTTLDALDRALDAPLSTDDPARWSRVREDWGAVLVWGINQANEALIGLAGSSLRLRITDLVRGLTAAGVPVIWAWHQGDADPLTGRAPAAADPLKDSALARGLSLLGHAIVYAGCDGDGDLPRYSLGAPGTLASPREAAAPLLASPFDSLRLVGLQLLGNESLPAAP